MTFHDKWRAIFQEPCRNRFVPAQFCRRMTGAVPLQWQNIVEKTTPNNLETDSFTIPSAQTLAPTYLASQGLESLIFELPHSGFGLIISRMEMWTNYITELHQAFGYLFANWVPQQKIALGDYGRFQKGVFHRDGKLEDLRIKVQRGEPDEARALYQYHSKNSSSAQMKLNASGKSAGAKAKAGLEIKFSDANSVFFNAAACALRTVTNTSAIGEAVRRKLEDGTWEYDWVVVTSLIEAKSTTAIVSSSSHGAIVLNAESDVTTIDLADASLKLAIASESNIGLKLVTEPNCSPLFACHQAHWRILGEPGWRTKLLREGVERSETAAQIQALRASGEMDINEFDFVEIGRG